jgi:hypothetical protein
VDPNQEGEQLAAGETSADQVYRWTVRGLYALAIALNVWMLWDAMDETKTEALKDRALRIRDRVMAPYHDRKLFRKHANQVVFEAMQVVDSVPPQLTTEETDTDG